MSDFPRDEIEQAFIDYWLTGCVREDWDAWADCFVEDVEYVDHWWGPLHGRDEVKLWINAVMRGVPEIYTPLDWYVIEGDTVAFHMQNRRDNPDPDGPPYFDFPGVSVIWYAGDGKFRAEEDFWDLTGARRTTAAYVEACTKMGVTDPIDRMTRKHWPTRPNGRTPKRARSTRRRGSTPTFLASPGPASWRRSSNVIDPDIRFELALQDLARRVAR